MQEIIRMLDRSLKYEGYEIRNDEIHIQVKSRRKLLKCPKCGRKTKKIHSRYIRTVQDMPIGNKKVYIEIASRKMFCRNWNCSQKTFAENYEFTGANKVKTKRLEAEIVSVGMNMSSQAASQMLNRSTVKICGRTVRNLIKKTERSKYPERV